MSAVEKVKKSAKEDAAVLKFQEAYAEALAEAQVSQEHTRTEGWQELYGAHRKADAAARRAIAASLRETADMVESRHLSEDEEKAAKDSLKQLIELHTDAEVFTRKTVEPVRQCVDRCSMVIADAKAAAERAESSAPLTSRGVGERIRAAIAEAPVVRWDADRGMVVIG